MGTDIFAGDLLPWDDKPARGSSAASPAPAKPFPPRDEKQEPPAALAPPASAPVDRAPAAEDAPAVVETAAPREVAHSELSLPEGAAGPQPAETSLASPAADPHPAPVRLEGAHQSPAHRERRTEAVLAANGEPKRAPSPGADSPVARPAAERPPSANPSATIPSTPAPETSRAGIEWRLLQRTFAYHPHVAITPLVGEPPIEYQIDFHVRTVILDESGSLTYAPSVSMRMRLPPGFPLEPPLVTPGVSLFHPNISTDGVITAAARWHASGTLASLISDIGNLLSFRDWDAETVANPAAMEWVTANPAELPLDPQSDFSPTAGGDPVWRITAYGHETLKQVRAAIEKTRAGLLADPFDPALANVKAFGQRMRMLLSLFLATDIPSALRDPAAEYDAWARELIECAPAWTQLRSKRDAAAAAAAAAPLLGDGETKILRTLTELDALLRAEPAEGPFATLVQIPEMLALGPVQMKLPALTRECEKRLAAARSALEAASAPAATATLDAQGPVGRRFLTEQQAVAQSLAASRQLLKTAIASLEVRLSQAKREAEALQQVVNWREYLDISAKGLAIERRLERWGAAGVHACYADAGGRRGGPFQLEEIFDFAGLKAFVRSNARGAIEVVDPATGRVLARGSNGEASVKSPGGSGGQTIAMRLTDRCEDIIAQLEFIHTRTARLLSGMQHSVAGAQSWCGRFAYALSGPMAQHDLRNDNRKTVHRGKLLRADLESLAPFKDRLATYLLVRRGTDLAARLSKELSEARERVKLTGERFRTTVARCGRGEGGQIIVPQKLAKAYADEREAHERAEQDAARITSILKSAVAQVKDRLAAPGLCGREGVPALRVLPPMPLGSIDAEAFTDKSMKDLVARLADTVKTPLVFTPAPAPRPPKPKEPAPREEEAGPAAEGLSRLFT